MMLLHSQLIINVTVIVTDLRICRFVPKFIGETATFPLAQVGMYHQQLLGGTNGDEFCTKCIPYINSLNMVSTI
jgi:hypothetical protein